MKLVWSAEEVLRAVRGHYLHPQDWTAHGVTIDSRTMAKEDLFVAIKGNDLDGHDYVRAAFDAGAAAAIVERQPQQVPPDAPLIFVENTMTALEDLGHVGRLRSRAKIIAVTGSVGKTSTKEQLRLMLSATHDTYANEGSLNNHWGVPLSLARLPAEAKFGVFELGMNHVGEMEALSRQVQPDIALITNIEAVHLEFFSSTEAIADAKAEIFLGMNASGVAVLPRDNPHYARLLAAARTQGLKKTFCFGRDPKSDAVLLSTKLDETGTHVEAEILGKKTSFTIGALGEHLAMNALGGLLACHAAGADMPPCLEALAAYRTPTRRGTIETIKMTAGGTVTLIDQTFNASPVATQAAIQVLGQLKTLPQSRKIVVLGDMRELGPSAPELHISLVKPLIENKIDRVHCCGEMMEYLYNNLPDLMRGHFCANSNALAPLVAADTRSGDVVMVKGSKSMHMETVVQALQALGNDKDHKLAS